jgi:hypothetical protein
LSIEDAHERVAQSVEHVTFNHGVVGSIPTALTKIPLNRQLRGAALLTAHKRRSQRMAIERTAHDASPHQLTVVMRAAGTKIRQLQQAQDRL